MTDLEARDTDNYRSSRETERRRQDEKKKKNLKVKKTLSLICRISLFCSNMSVNYMFISSRVEIKIVKLTKIIQTSTKKKTV